VVAVASRARVELADTRALGWTVGALVVLLVGLGLRVLLGGAGVGDRSATVMSGLLCVGAWAAARMLGGPRVAFGVTLLVVALLDFAALPQRTPPAYDDLQAFYRTDQVLTSPVAVPPGLDPNTAALTMLVQPTFAGSQPRFGLAGSVNGAQASWSCAFQPGVQALALPLPSGALRSGPTADVELHLSGTPSRETDYLVVYASSQRGGFILGLAPLASLDARATRCTLA
jgi:hypothetical protein